jgi:hypothetical protein
MKTVTLEVDDLVYAFFARVGRQADKPAERVMADGLFRLAGELAAQMRRPVPFPRR